MTEDIFETPSSTPNFQTELATQLAELVPEAVTDGKIDVTKLHELLSDDVADASERFGLFWPGKKQAQKIAQTPSTATLRPDIESSVKWDESENLFIEGDNLEVLKLLQKHYHAKIKMIYIDPPYNTGKDFVYTDKYAEGVKSYLEWTSQINQEGKAVATNSETDGRYHSNWLNMMYPRLKLARSLLTDDGLIFVSISDHEVAQLRKVLDEIFGEDNFIGCIIWNSTKSVTNTALISVSHTYNLIYAKRGTYFTENRSAFRLPDSDEGFGNPDGDPRGPWKADPFQVGGWRPNQQYEITNPNTGVVYKPNPGSSWKNDLLKFTELLADNRIVFGTSGQSGPQRKRFLTEALERGKVSKTLWDDVSTTTNATQALKDLFEGESPFDTPKPVDLIKRMLQLGTTSDSTVLDFFAGSSTTAQAVLELNAEDGGSRSFIQVQLPEPVAQDSAAKRMGYTSISEVSRSRIRKVIEKIERNLETQLGDQAKELDLGFRAFRLSDSGFAKWRVRSDIDHMEIEQQLFDLRESADGHASQGDLLFEILLKQGHSLTEKIEAVDIEGLPFHSIGGGVILAYLNEHQKPSLDIMRAAVLASPSKLIVLEDAFQGDDELKTNLAQLCRSNGVELWSA